MFSSLISWTVSFVAWPVNERQNKKNLKNYVVPLQKQTTLSFWVTFSEKEIKEKLLMKLSQFHCWRRKTNQCLFSTWLAFLCSSRQILNEVAQIENMRIVYHCFTPQFWNLSHVKNKSVIFRHLVNMWFIHLSPRCPITLIQFHGRCCKGLNVYDRKEAVPSATFASLLLRKATKTMKTSSFQYICR